jgi:hypothetical protein
MDWAVPCAAFTLDGHLHAVWMQDYGGVGWMNVEHAELGPNGWTVETVANRPSGVKELRLATGPTGELAIAWVGIGQVELAQRKVGVWSVETALEPAFPGAVSLALDETGAPHLAVLSGAGTHLLEAHRGPGNSWLTTDVTPPNTVLGGDPRPWIVSRGGGLFWIFYTVATTTSDRLVEISWDGQRWSTPTTVIDSIDSVLPARGATNGRVALLAFQASTVLLLESEAGGWTTTPLGDFIELALEFDGNDQLHLLEQLEPAVMQDDPSVLYGTLDEPPP